MKLSPWTLVKNHQHQEERLPLQPTWMRELDIAEREVSQHSEQHIEFQICSVEQQRTTNCDQNNPKGNCERNSWRTHGEKNLCLGCHTNAQPYHFISGYSRVNPTPHYKSPQGIQCPTWDRLLVQLARVALAGWASKKVLVRKNYSQLDEDERKSVDDFLFNERRWWNCSITTFGTYCFCSAITISTLCSQL